MKADDFKALKIKIDNFVDFDEAKAEATLLAIPKMYQELVDTFSKEMHVFNTIKQEYDVVIAELLKFYKFEDKHAWNNKQEIDIRMKSDKRYLEMNEKLIKQKFVVDYLENSMNNVKNLSFTIKHWIEYKKFVMLLQ